MALADTRNVLQVVGLLADLSEALVALPELHPIAQKLLGSVLHGNNGHTENPSPGSPERRSPAPPTGRPRLRRKAVLAPAEPRKRASARPPMSAATKAKMRKAAKERWAAAKRAGKNTIGGAE